MGEVIKHLDSVNARIKANHIRAEDLANSLTESLLSDDTISSIFNDWENRMDEGSFSKSMTDMLSEVALFNNDKDLLLNTEDSHYTVISYWLIERAAFYGSRPEFLRQLLGDSFKLAPGQLDTMYSSEVITKFLGDNEKLIASRRFMLLKDLECSSINLSKMIRDRINEIDIILRDLTTAKDFKYYAQISSTWLKSLELLAKLLGKFTNQSAQVNIKTTNIQNYITINTTIIDKLDTLVTDKSVPKKYIDLVKKSLTEEMKEVYDVPEDTDYSLQRVG